MYSVPVLTDLLFVVLDAMEVANPTAADTARRRKACGRIGKLIMTRDERLHSRPGHADTHCVPPRLRGRHGWGKEDTQAQREAQQWATNVSLLASLFCDSLHSTQLSRRTQVV